MKVVQKGEFSGTRQELETEIADFKQALENHKTTVGEPAPWPNYEILRVLVRLPADQWVLEDEVEGDDTPNSSETRPLTAEELYDILEAKGVVNAQDRPRPKGRP